MATATDRNGIRRASEDQANTNAELTRKIAFHARMGEFISCQVLEPVVTVPDGYSAFSELLSDSAGLENFRTLRMRILLYK